MRQLCRLETKENHVHWIENRGDACLVSFVQQSHMQRDG